MPETIISQYARAYNSPIETNRQVNTSTDRDNISSSVRWRGMLVHVIADDVTYELVGGIDNGSWQPLVGLQDAPSDGETYGRKDGNWEILDFSGAYVDLSTDQTINGVKTFNNRVEQTGLGSSTFFGEDAGSSDDLTGNNNTGFGTWALMSNIAGSNNVAFGYQSLSASTAASTNTAIGALSLLVYGSGQSNSSIGFGSMMNLSSGDFNTALGTNAGRYRGSGSDPLEIAEDGIYIGSSARASADSQTNEIVIGRNAEGGGSNTITLGNSSITSLRCQVTTITSLSDVRDKKNILPITGALDIIKKLNPVSFEWDQRDGGKKDKKATGFLAQELLKVQEDEGIGDYLDLVDKTDPDRLEARYGHLLPLIVRAIQELNEKI